jgi:putative redox protein
MAFEAEVNGHKIILDAGSHVGGEDRGHAQNHLCLQPLAVVLPWM